MFGAPGRVWGPLGAPQSFGEMEKAQDSFPAHSHAHPTQGIWGPPSPSPAGSKGALDWLDGPMGLSQLCVASMAGVVGRAGACHTSSATGRLLPTGWMRTVSGWEVPANQQPRLLAERFNLPWTSQLTVSGQYPGLCFECIAGGMHELLGCPWRRHRTGPGAVREEAPQPHPGDTRGQAPNFPSPSLGTRMAPPLKTLLPG